MIGFDLDLTLVDGREGIGAALRGVVAETGVYVDVDLAMSRFGRPMELELARWFPAEQVDAALAVFVKHLADGGARQVVALPGALSALEAASRRASTLVVTRKPTDLALISLTACGLTVDKIVGGVWGDAKAIVLAEHAASVYVGDDAADMSAAATANAIGVGVTTGLSSRAELLAAGARVVLPDLTAFAEWLE